VDPDSSSTSVTRVDRGTRKVREEQAYLSLAHGRGRAATVHEEEARRTVGWCLVVVMLTTFVTCWVPSLGGARWLQIAMLASLAYLGVACAVVGIRARDPARFSTATFRFLSVSAVVCSLVYMYYLGFFSPTPLVVTFGIAYFGQGSDRVTAFGTAVASAVAYVCIASSLTLGWLPDLSIFPATLSSPTAKWFMVATVPAVYVVVLIHARVAHRAAITSIERTGEVARTALQRLGQLEEMRDQLDDALHAGVGMAGHYTSQLAGHYLLKGLLGRGGMGEVYVGESLDGSEQVAVKLIVPHLADEAALARFEREAAITEALDHPHIVSVLETGRLADGSRFLVMERLQGRVLSELLRVDPLELGEIRTLVRQLAGALDHAHAAGVVHRDLKPANLFRTSRAGAVRWVVLDFGIGKLGDSDATLTRGQVLGTVDYMAPEQAQGVDVTAAADLYAFGALLYRLLVGQSPVRGRGSAQKLYNLLHERPLRPRAMKPDLPADLERVLAWSLAPYRDDRPSTAGELAVAFEAAVEQALSPELRRHVDELLEDFPWAVVSPTAAPPR